MQRISVNKQKNRSLLESKKNDYLATIYDGLVHQKPIKQIHKELYRQTINEEIVDKVMFSNALKLTNKISKKIKKSDIALGLDFLSIAIFGLFEKLDADKYLTKNIYDETSKIESKEKEKALKEGLADGRSIGQVFYLASRHNDSALDHEPYQGKIYVDENWKNVIDDENIKKEIRNYIRIHDVKTFQWVIDRPVWFITRPNCRHYFKRLPTEEVLGKSVEQLIKENDMSAVIGPRRNLQTFKHRTDRKWYDDVRNAELILERYERRLKVHEKLYKTYPNHEIASAIQKDKLLISKWKHYLSLKNKKK